MKKLLFICSQNRLRSPTAEQVFSAYPHIEARSAGLDNDAIVKVGTEDLEWADHIFVMEKKHRNKLQKKYRAFLRNKSVYTLEIPDDYEFMDEELISILKRKVPRYVNI